MRISKWGEYGILCGIHMAKQALKDKDSVLPVGAAELAYSQAIPLQYTQQILQKLRKGDIVRSVRGPGGGYILSRDCQDISVRDILLATEGDTLEIICDKNTIFSTCSEGSQNCSLKNVWHELRATIDTYLESKTLFDLATAEHASSRSMPNLIAIPSVSR